MIENASLKVAESALTGESLAVEKSMETIATEVPLGDRKNMLFSGKSGSLWKETFNYNPDILRFFVCNQCIPG